MKLLEHLSNLFSVISVQKVSFMILSVHRYIDSKLQEISTFLLQIYNDYSGMFTTGSVIIAIKFLLSIALLIFIRGGLPRYRFDHLTKVGWVKFLSLIVCFLLIELLFLYTVMS